MNTIEKTERKKKLQKIFNDEKYLEKIKHRSIKDNYKSVLDFTRKGNHKFHYYLTCSYPDEVYCYDEVKEINRRLKRYLVSEFGYKKLLDPYIVNGKKQYPNLPMKFKFFIQKKSKYHSHILFSVPEKYEDENFNYIGIKVSSAIRKVKNTSVFNKRSHFLFIKEMRGKRLIGEQSYDLQPIYEEKGLFGYSLKDDYKQILGFSEGNDYSIDFGNSDF